MRFFAWCIPSSTLQIPALRIRAVRSTHTLKVNREDELPGPLPISIVRGYLTLQESGVLIDEVWLIYVGHFHYLAGS